MTLDYEKYAGISDGMHGGRRSPRRRESSGRLDLPIKKEQPKPTPESRILSKLAVFEPKPDADPEEVRQLNNAKSDYVKWVNDTLRDKRDNVMEDSDLLITEHKGGWINVHHAKSGFQTQGVGNEIEYHTKLIYAKDALLTLIERHLRDWRNVSADFRREQGVTL
jgi:hypothetical protein